MASTDGLRSVAVFCGSNTGRHPAFVEAAERLGTLLAERGLTLVYGGGSVGLMGVLADAVMAGGGNVVGVIPRSLWDREVGHDGLTELVLTDSMHERKRLMYDRADAVIAMPGGIGTLDELFETLTWNQLGIMARPCGLLDVEGYFAPLITWIDGAVDQGFLRREHADTLHVDQDPDRLLDRLAVLQMPVVEKWL